MTDKTPDPCGSDSSAKLWLRVFMTAQYIMGIVVVFVTVRTLAPSDISWWQAAAFGGFSSMLSHLWCVSPPRLRHNTTDDRR